MSHLSDSISTGSYGRPTRRTEIDASATTLRPSRAAELVFGHTSENRMGTGGPSPSRAGRVAVIDTNMLRRSVLCSPESIWGEETSMLRRNSRFGLRVRTWTAAFLAMVVAAVLLAQPASATTPTEGSGTFTFAAAPTSSRTAGGNTFLSLTGTETISGPITGVATVQFTQVIHSSGEANIN